VYQWKRNGNNISSDAAGIPPSNLSNALIGAGDVITCQVTPGGGCVDGSIATSNAITVLPKLAPSVSISANTTACPTKAVTFTASPTNGGSAPVYNWQINEAAAPGATNSATYTSSSLVAGQRVRCLLISSLECYSTPSPTVASNTITVSPYPVDGTIAASRTTLTLGESVTITSTGGNGPPYYWCSTDGGTTWNVFAMQYGGQYTFQHTPAAPGIYRYHLRNRTDCGFCYELGSCATFPNVDVTVQAMPSSGQNQNYVETVTVTAEGIKTETQVAALTSDQAQRNIVYFDGIGRPVQQVQWQASPTRKDVVQPMLYDKFGRERFKFLPYADTDGGNDGWFKTGTVNKPATENETDVPTAGKLFTFYNQAQSTNPETVFTPWANTPKPFAQTRFEASPLNRALEQGAPGQNWQIVSTEAPGNNRTLKTSQRTNNTNEVRYWTYDAATGTTKSIKNHDPGTLFVAEVTDEHKQVTLEYKDKSGQVVCKKGQDGVTDATPPQPTFLETHYVYDDFGLLRTVIQPEGVANLGQVYTGTEYQIANTGTFAQQWCFTYRYDYRNRMTEKRVPGAGPVYLVYNERDELILTQDAAQRGKTNKEWSFTKYDALGRVIMTGICQHAAVSQSAMQTAADGAGSSYETRTNANEGYTVGSAFPNLSQLTHQSLTVNYYDDYNFDYSNNGDPADRDEDYAPAGLSPEPVPSWRTTGRPTGSKTRNLEDNAWLLSVSFYDKYGRVIQTRSGNHLGGKDIATVVYDFAGRVLQRKTEHTGRERVSVKEEFTYDHASRPLAHYHQVNDGNKILLKSQSYNELGQLVRKDLHARSTTGTATNQVAAKIQNGANVATTTPPATVTLTGGATYKATQEILFTGEYNTAGQELAALLTADNPGTATNPAEYLQTANF
jgi:hypothetical protein